MKGILLVLLCMLTPMILSGQNSLVVTIEGVSDRQGTVMVGLFTDQKTFLKEATYGKIVPVGSGSTRVIFENLEPGEYGISVIHDRNNNGKLDTNFLGLPKEGFAFGNNAMGVFGPPSFEKAKVTIESGEQEQLIRMKYF